MPRSKKKPKERKLPTLAECEKAIGEPASAWVARCYEIAHKIVTKGLVDGEAVYGHWIGKVAPGSHFADRARLGFVNHGWIQLADGQVMDPTRWVFEDVAPYLYVGEPHGPWSAAVPCGNCDLLKEEHGDHGPADQCDMFAPALWPYDEGGNTWREALTRGRPPPEPMGRRHEVKLEGMTVLWIGALLGEPDGARLTMNQLSYLANYSYTAMFKAIGPAGVRAVYEAIRDVNDHSISWIPIDNANRARRECGFKVP